MRPATPALALALVALLLAPLAGTAHARIALVDEPRDLSILHPLEEEGALAALLHGQVVRYWWSNGSHDPLVRLTPFTRHAVSPDAAWVVRRHLEEDPATGNFTDTARAVRVADGNETVLRTGELRGLASGGGLVAVTAAGNESAWVWRWGEWDRPRALWANLTEEVEARNPVRQEGGGFISYGYGGPPLDASRAGMLALSPDGGWLALEIERALYVFNVTTGRLLSPWAASVDDRVVGLAFSPDGAHLAALTSQVGRFSELHVFRLTEDGLEPRALRRHVEAGRGVAWGAPGLAIVQTAHDAPYGPPSGVVVRAYVDGAPLEDERAWRESPARASGGIAFLGGRLAVEVNEGLRLFADGVTPVLASHPGHPPTFHDALRPPGAWGPDEIFIPVTVKHPPSETPPSGEPPSREAPLPAWLPFAAALAALAVRLRRPRGVR